jgi:membrane fusion protein, multidrug efflux system
VTVGPRVGSQWVIQTGLTAEDRVVVEGAQRLRPGVVVTPKAAAEATSGTTPPPPAHR